MQSKIYYSSEFAHFGYCSSLIKIFFTTNVMEGTMDLKVFELTSDSIDSIKSPQNSIWFFKSNMFSWKHPVLASKNSLYKRPISSGLLKMKRQSKNMVNFEKKYSRIK